MTVAGRRRNGDRMGHFEKLFEFAAFKQECCNVKQKHYVDDSIAYGKNHLVGMQRQPVNEIIAQVEIFKIGKYIVEPIGNILENYYLCLVSKEFQVRRGMADHEEYYTHY